MKPKNERNLRTLSRSIKMAVTLKNEIHIWHQKYGMWELQYGAHSTLLYIYNYTEYVLCTQECVLKEFLLMFLTTSLKTNLQYSDTV
jgi:hypothetical protein